MSEKLDSAQSAINFYLEFIYPFQNMPRQGWIDFWGVKKEDAESVAEHIFSVAFLAQFANREYNLGLDIGKVLELAITHELDELIVGDVPVRDKEGQIQKENQKEYIRAEIGKKLAGFKSKEYFLSLYDEFEAQETSEAKFIKEIDKLAFSLQGLAYCKSGTGDKGKMCDGEKLTQYTENEIRAFKALQEVVQKIKLHSI